jgi:MFS family permease
MREMFLFLRNLKGNAKAAVLSQPLWGIPFNLFTPFAALYMYKMGVTDIHIGIVLAAGRFAQMALAFFGGVITDKFGRRLTSLVGDIVSWSIPALIWAFAQDFRWFLVAAVVNGVVQITGVAWECLWVDEVGDDGAKTTQIYNWLHVCGLLAVFFAPLAGVLVGRFELVPVVRGLYFFAFVSMTTKAFLLFKFTKETERGKERMAATKNVPMSALLLGYRDVAKQILRSGEMLRALALQSFVGVTMLVSGTFFAIYATQNLLLSDAMLSYFPILRAVVMLFFLFIIQSKLNVFNSRNVMLCGIFMYIAAHALLLVAPPQNLPVLAVYILLESCAVALFMPRLGALTANVIEPTERARIRSLFNVGILAMAVPFAYLSGILSDLDRRLPFVLNIFLFIAMIFFLARKKKICEN